MDMSQGAPISCVWRKPITQGSITGSCSEFCGVAHAAYAIHREAHERKRLPILAWRRRKPMTEHKNQPDQARHEELERAWAINEPGWRSLPRR